MIAEFKNWLITYALWLLLAALAGVALLAGVQTLRLANAKRTIAEISATNAKAVAAAESAARSAEHATNALGTAAAANYEKGKADANTAQSALLADLLSVRIRMHSRWECPATPIVPRAGGSAAEPDASAEDRLESASRIVGAADSCDAQVNALRGFVCADRGMRLVGTECKP